MKPAPEKKRVLGTQELADLLDVDQSTILKWVKLGLPCDKPTSRKAGFTFDEAEAAAWMEENKKTGKIGRPPEEGSDELQKLKIRKEAVLVRKYERQEAVEEGRLIDAAEEQARDVAKIVAVRNRLCGLGAAISPQLEGLDGAGRQSIIDNAIAEILADFGSAK